MFDLAQRFAIGINLDDPWRYAGLAPPKSIVIPHLLSLSIPEGRILDEIDDSTLRLHGDVEPTTYAERASLALAERLVDARVDFVRCWFYWRYFEPTPCPAHELQRLLDASYGTWPMDPFVQVLTDHGVGIVPVVACGYQRMLPAGLHVDSDRDLYVHRAYVHTRLLVRRYKPRIKFWQIENEPNWWQVHAAGGWRSGVAWLDPHGFRGRLLQVLRSAVHEEDPNALAIINVEADAEHLDMGAYASYCELMGFDFYPNYRSASPINLAVFKRADQEAERHGNQS